MSQAHSAYNSVAPRLLGYQSELRLQLQWLDGFRPARAVLSPSLCVDWASLRWNHAALISAQGARQERSSDEGLKLACKHFQEAAGIFEHILTHLLPLVLSNSESL